MCRGRRQAGQTKYHVVSPCAQPVTRLRETPLPRPPPPTQPTPPTVLSANKDLLYYVVLKSVPSF